MSYDDYDDDYHVVRSVDLERADKGFMLCPECEGQGTYMFHKCYPSGPVECEEYCYTCEGEGQIEIPAKACVSRNKREGRFAGKRWVDEVKKLTRTGHSPYNQWLALRPDRTVVEF